VPVRGCLLVLIGSLFLTSGSATARPLAGRTAACGSITARLGGNDYSYRIRIVSGTASCVTARSVLRGFIARSVTPRRWFCSRGHSRDAWAASCARSAPRALVRALLIAG
jgi:hypothetical protein